MVSEMCIRVRVCARKRVLILVLVEDGLGAYAALYCKFANGMS